MPEGVAPYPRWNGTLAEGGQVRVVAEQEVFRAWQKVWSRIAFLLGLAWGLASIIQLYQLRQTGDIAHGMDGYIAMMDQLRWFALGVAATVGGPALLDDVRTGALELYLTRSLTARHYLLGKSAAVVGLTAITMLAPAIVYWGASFLFYEQHPERWGAALLPALGYALMWTLVVSGIALGVSAVSRTSRASALLVFGGFALADIVIGDLLAGLTRNEELAVLSPFAAIEAQWEWMLGQDAVHAFPYWWGLIVLGVLLLIGWLLVAFRHPRVRGEEA